MSVDQPNAPESQEDTRHEPVPSKAAPCCLDPQPRLMPQILFFDTETTGLARNPREPASAGANWPRAVQIAWMAADADGSDGACECHLIKPDGFTIPKDASRVHGITTAKATRDGIGLRDALDAFAKALEGTDLLVAHNLAFDAGVLGSEFLRLGLGDPFPTVRSLCTMQATTRFLAIPGPYGFKWPRLEELHQRLFGHPHAGAHDAGADVRACADCFFELGRLGILSIPQA